MGIIPQREIIQIKKNDSIIFDEESFYEISKPYLKFVTDGRAYALSFEVGGIKLLHFEIQKTTTLKYLLK